MSCCSLLWICGLICAGFVWLLGVLCFLIRLIVLIVRLSRAFGPMALTLIAMLCVFCTVWCASLCGLWLMF